MQFLWKPLKVANEVSKKTFNVRKCFEKSRRLARNSKYIKEKYKRGFLGNFVFIAVLK